MSIQEKGGVLMVHKATVRITRHYVMHLESGFPFYSTQLHAAFSDKISPELDGVKITLIMSKSQVDVEYCQDKE